LTNDTSFVGPILRILDFDGSFVQLLLVGGWSVDIRGLSLQAVTFGVVLGHGSLLSLEKVGRTIIF
jgi:hypothetical protein